MHLQNNMAAKTKMYIYPTNPLLFKQKRWYRQLQNISLPVSCGLSKVLDFGLDILIGIKIHASYETSRNPLAYHAKRSAKVENLYLPTYLPACRLAGLATYLGIYHTSYLVTYSSYPPSYLATKVCT